MTRKMETNLPDIYAAGDCTETWHHLLNRSTYMPLGSTAHKQGRIAGENAVGGTHEFAGTLGTQVVKVFDLVIARTGLRDDEAVQAGFDPFTTEVDHLGSQGLLPRGTRDADSRDWRPQDGTSAGSADDRAHPFRDRKADRRLCHGPVPRYAYRGA